VKAGGRRGFRCEAATGPNASQPLKEGVGTVSALERAHKFGGRLAKPSAEEPIEAFAGITSGEPERKSRVSLVAVALMLPAAALLLPTLYWYVMPSKSNYFQIAIHPLTIELAGPGLVDAINKVTLSPRIQGRINSMTVDRNDSVKKEQIVATLDAEDLKNQLVAAQADAKAAEGAVTEALSEAARFESLRAKALSELERREKLSRTGVVPTVEIENLEFAARETAANVERARAAVERQHAAAASAAANVLVLEARLANATIRSPITGIVVSRERNVGDMLMPGTQIMQLVDPNSIIVTARFDESVMGMITVGQSARIRFASMPNRVFEGSLLRLARQVDPETREFTVDVVPKMLPEFWALGQRAMISIDGALPSSAVAIPTSFVARISGRAGVWKLSGSRADWTPITLGFLGGQMVEVVEGLGPGEIILDPRNRYELEPITLARE
jgi:HlyD family secretion protein